MTIRILHHWACSGGTILSRAISSLPRVVLLSEMHPLAHLRLTTASQEYSPTDVIQQLCLPHNGRDPVLCVATWNGAIDALQQALAAEQKHLVLRSHSHIDFFTGANCREQPLVSRCLAPRHQLLELFSVRHPLDCWISIQAQGWHHHFRFPSLAEFCRRGLRMMESCAGLPLLRYEDFTLQPDAALQLVSGVLQLPDGAEQRDTLAGISLSGDSGRSGDIITPRPRRPLPHSVLEELQRELAATNQHSPYQNLCAQLGYAADPSTAHPFTLASNPPPHLLQPLPR